LSSNFPSALPDFIAPRLLGAVLVLDQGEADMLVAILAEADARRHRDLRFLEQIFAELHRAHFLRRLGNFGPDKHRPLGSRNMPAGAVEAVEQRVAPLLIH
jgi:hypothetical protein